MGYFRRREVMRGASIWKRRWMLEVENERGRPDGTWRFLLVESYVTALVRTPDADVQTVAHTHTHTELLTNRIWRDKT